jgi:hypothetical protein
MTMLHAVLIGVLAAVLLLRLLDAGADRSTRFTVRDLLFVMTFAAIVLGAIGFMLRT